MFDTQPISDAVPVRRDASPDTPRSASGGFTGPGWVELATAPPPLAYTALADAGRILETQLATAIDRLLCEGRNRTSEAALPVAALQASPGAGKSRAARQHLAARDDIGGDIVWHAPTLALAEEACAHALELGADAHVFRGRSALDPATRAPMCAKPDLATKVARAGLPVGRTLCRREDDDGNAQLCPHFHTCAYQRQSANLPATDVQRYLSTAYLGLPDPTGREIALRVIDETFWRSMIRTRQVTLDAFTTPRDGLPQPRRDPLKSSRTRRHADLLAAAGAVAQMLTDKASLDTLPYTAEDLDDFAREEVRAAPREPDIRPDQREADQSAALETMAEARRARDFARIWRILAEAKRQERPCSERLTLTQDDQGVRRIRLFGRCDLPKDAPLLLLDADADPKILRAFVPGARIETLSLRPNAHVVQVGDRRMSNGTLLKSDAIRRDWVAVIRAEVLRDRAGRKCGVLVGATRKVVRAFFRDAGHDFTGLSEAEVSARMLDTELHGARWTWFGGRALGENRYRDFSTAIVIGREELPVAALEDQARALFGDTPGETLACIAPDGDGRRLLPDETVAYPVEHGRARGTWVRIHPDPRIAALQRQTRECATRQLVERLRLPHATYPKRVLLGCNIPIPGLPVSRLVNFEDLVPSRLAKACLEAFLENRPLRLSAPGLHADASHTFPTLEAAKCFVKRSLQSEIEDLRLGCTMLRVRLRTAVRGARSVDVLVPAQDAQTARAMAETAYGALARFDLISAVSYGKIGNRSKGRQAGVQDPLGFVSPRLRPTA